MAAMQNVEAEAAKFLQKLIHESKDEPAKLATKLYVILQHMTASGKENSMPYQVISKAMETVINDHGLDFEALKSSRLPTSGGPQIGESSQSQSAGSKLTAGVANESKSGLKESNLTRADALSSSLPPAGSYVAGHPHQVPASHRSGTSLDHESPSSLDTRSADSYSQDRRDRGSWEQQANQRETKKTTAKRKKSGSTLVIDPHTNTSQHLEAHGQGADMRQGKLVNKIEPGSFPGPAVNFQAGSTGVSNSYMAVGGFSGTPSFGPSGKIPVDSEYWKPAFNGANANFPERPVQGHVFSTQLGEEAKPTVSNPASRSVVENAGSSSNMSMDADRVQGAAVNTLNEMNMLRGAASGDSAKSVVSPIPSAPGMPFKEHHLKQLRAQCLVFLAFRNGIMPKRMHLEIALGSNLQTEGNNFDGASRDSVDSRGKEQAGVEPNKAIQEKIIHGGKGLRHETVIGGHAHADNLFSTPLQPYQGSDMEQEKIMPANDAKTLGGHGLPGQTVNNGNQYASLGKRSSECEEEALPRIDALLPSAEYTTSEYWIMVHQKRRLVSRQSWVKKQEKVNQSIRSRFNELKETVSSSEDISAKTKSVIELKKLQLIELQRRLRSNLMNDFFKVIKPEIDYLKGIKKHRIGRRLKQVEKYEQRMKEERQKRIRERQKEFFSELELHKDRLEDLFKFKRERGRGFNKYVKEFHKRKERIHREKIDRIQREKINLLKINDVEGYLRMVQDAKSDRVKQLLKETEKYLQKLGSKLQEAKTVARLFEAEMDEDSSSSIYECSFIGTENEDENDQAKHYKESNEKYYMIAHSIKENITEQPTSLRGGKLREYQMNGLRWLVSLYNNHLNGILADEMGLGKTVQVIALMCYLMEAKNDRGPFLVVVPSSVLPGWESEINFWAPGINKIVYSGPPEERRKLFKERIIHQKFNVLLTTYEYLMNKHDRPKLSKVHWHYIIIDEGHRIKNASCKLNADLKYYHSSHRLLLTGTPLQNNLEELWALLNFLLPNIFNSSEDFSQWFNKPFESNGDNSADEALLSEEENLLIINRLHQVLRPFVLRRLKHKVENELPEKIERLVRCEASAYQKLLMKRVEDNLGPLGSTKVRSVHNSVIELRNICNHPYLSQLHTDEVDALIPKHFLPPIVRLCGKLEVLDRLLPKLKATNHRILFFSTMTRLLDVMEEYLGGKKYPYLRLDGHTSGSDRGALIEKFNHPDSPFFIFLLSIRAGGVGVNLQAADTVIIFDTDWNPQVDLQAQARAHRIGQKKDVLVLRLETVNTVEEQVRAAAEHKLGVANQSITAGFFDNNTSAEDRREYLESLLRECKKEEAAPVLNDDGLNDLLARSESEIEIFESIDRKRQEEEMEAWKKMLVEQGIDGSGTAPPLPPRLVTDEELKPFYEAMRLYEVRTATAPNTNVKRKRGHLGGFDTQQYGRGKRAREVRSYEEQWNEEEFEKICQDPGSLTPKEEIKDALLSVTGVSADKIERISHLQGPITSEQSPIKQEVTPPIKRGRGRPKRVPVVASPSALAHPLPTVVHSQAPSPLSNSVHACPDSVTTEDASGRDQPVGVKMESNFQTTSPLPSLMANSSGVMPPSDTSEPASARLSSEVQGAADVGRQRGRKPYNNPPSALTGPSSSAAISLGVQNPQSSEAPTKYVLPSVTSVLPAQSPSVGNAPVKEAIRSDSGEMIFNSQTTLPLAAEPSGRSPKGKGTTEAGHCRGRKSNKNSSSLPAGSAVQALKSGDQPVVYTSSSSAFAVQNIQVTEQSGAHASQSLKSGERPVKETVSALLADSVVATREDANKHVFVSTSAGYCVQGLDSNSQVVKETSSTAPPGLAIQSEESSKQLSKQAPTSVASSLALQEPKSRKRKTKPLSSDISSLAVASPVASPGNPLLQGPGPVVSVVLPSSISAATMALSGSPPCVGGPFSVPTASDSQHMPHERQMNKSRSGAEPARRRGRKPTLPTDAAPIESLIQDSRIAPPVTAFPGPPGVVNLAMASRTVANPVVPLVPLSGLIPGFIAVKDSIGSVHHSNVGSPPTSKSNPQSSSTVSAQADPSLKTEGQTQESSFRETTPRRRGRKTAPAASSGPSIFTGQDSSLRHMESVAGDLREGKHARLNLEDGSLASGKVQEAQSAIDHAPSLIKEAESNVENTIPPANVAIPATVIEESASNKANEVDKSLESKKELSAADAPLMSSNVHVVTSRLPICKTTLVLALRAAELKAAALNSRASASEPDGNSSSNFAALSQLYDEMSAPPGFDTPRACLDATVGTSLGSENAKSKGKSAVLHEEFSLPGNKLMLGPNEALVDPADFVDDDSAPPGFDMGKSCLVSAKISNSLQAKQAESSSGASFEPDVPRVETQLDSTPGDGIDSSNLVDEDSVPPGFEPETCDFKEKNGSAEVSISLTAVSLKGNEGQNSVDISHEVCHDVQTSVVLENLAEKHEKETKDVSNFQKDDDPFQAKDLGLACEASIIKPEIDVPSEGFKGSLTVGSVENTCALDTGKAGDGSSKIPPDSLHLSGASVLLTEKNSPDATSVESLVEQTEPTIKVSFFCLADLNVVADACVSDLQGKASPESLAGPVLEDLVKHCAYETKDGCHVENEEGPIPAVVLGTAHEVDIGKPGLNVSSTSDDASLKEGTEEDMGVLEMGKDGDSSSKIPPVNAALVEFFVEQAEPSTMPSACKADLNTLVDASVGDIESKASGDNHVNSDVGFVDYHVDAADASGSVLVSRHEENSQDIDADETKSRKSDLSTESNEETGGRVEFDGKDDLVNGNSIDTTNSSENVAEPVESVPENLITEVNTKDASNPDACQVVGRTAESSAAIVLESQSQLFINEDLSTKKPQDTVDSSAKADENTADGIKISVIGSCDEGSMADVNSEEDTVKPLSKSESSSLFDSSLSCAASSEKQEVVSPCSAQVVHSAELPLNTMEISSTQPEENADAAVIVASEPCGNRSSSEDADLSQHPISEDLGDTAVLVASNTVSADNEIMVAVCSMQPITGTSSNVDTVSVSENLPPTEISLYPVEAFGCKPEENADTATVMLFEAGGNTSSATEDTDLMLAVDPSLAVAQDVVSREDPMTEAESSTQPVLDTSSEVPKVSVSDDIGRASQLNLKEREEACRVDQSASLGNSDDDLVTQALEPQACTAKEKHLSAEVPISSSTVFIEDQNLMEESHGIDHAVKTSLVPEDLVEKDDPLQAVELGTHKGGISEPEIGLISDPVIRHEEESPDIDVVDHKSEESDPSTQLTVDSGSPLKLDQKDDSVVGDGEGAANSAENVAKSVEPVPENQMNEVNSENVLIPEARQEVDRIAESPVDNITELQSHPTSEELSAKQSQSANDVGVSVTESHENADATGILVSKTFVNGSSSEDGDFSQHPVSEASMDPSIMATSDAVSGDDLMVESECSMQPTMGSSSDATDVEPSHRDPRDDLMVEAECSTQPVLETLSIEAVVPPFHGVSGDDQMKTEYSSQPVLETSSDAAIVELSHTECGDELVVEAACPVLPVLETENDAGDLEPSHDATGDGHVEEAECPMQPVLETSSDAAALEPSHDVTGDNHVEKVKSPRQPGVSADGITMEAESVDKLMLEPSGDAAIAELFDMDSGDDLMVEAECPMPPVLKTSIDTGDLEPSHDVIGDDHVVEAEGPMQPVPETSSAAAALEPSHDVAGDNHAEEAECPMPPVLETSSDAAALEASHDVTGDAVAEKPESVSIDADVEPSNGVTSDEHTEEAECPVQPPLETSGDAVVVQLSHGVSGDDEMVQAESTVQPMMETSGDAAIVEPPHVVSGDDRVEAECSKQPTLDTSSEAVVVEPSQVVSDDRHVAEAEQPMIESSPFVAIVELSHGVDGDKQMAEAEVPMQPGLETSREVAAVEPSHGILGDDQMVEAESSEHRLLETSSNADVDPSYDVVLDVHKEEAKSSEDPMLETSCNAADVDLSHGVAVDNHKEEAECSEHHMLETSTDAADVHPSPSVAVDDAAVVLQPSNSVTSDDHLPETESATQPLLESSTEPADLEPSHVADCSGSTVHVSKDEVQHEAVAAEQTVLPEDVNNEADASLASESPGGDRLGSVADNSMDESQPTPSQADDKQPDSSHATDHADP